MDADRQVDIRLGANIRLRRRMLGMSQSVLAAHLGLTFQQVQKYERGVNRVAASTLLRVAGALNCSVDDLFEGTAPPAVAKITTASEEPWTPHAMAADLLASPGGLALVTAWRRMGENHRRGLLAAARAFTRNSRSSH